MAHQKKGDTLAEIPALLVYLNDPSFMVFDSANVMIVYNSSTSVTQPLDITVANPVKLVIGAPVNQTLPVAPGTKLGEIELLKEFFENKLFALVNTTGQNSFLQANETVSYDTYIFIERLKTVEVVIQPEESGTISIDEVKSDIIGIIDGNKDAISDVSVIKDGENGLIIIITVVDKSIESVVGSLKNCIN